MKQVGEYQITHTNIAKGAFASIHKGKHIYSNYIVAVKEIKLDGGPIKNYIKREIEIHRSLDHPNIVKVLDVIYDPAAIYIIMEFCQYGDLQKFQNKKPFSHKHIQYYMLQLRDALQYLRTRNIVHRDLKPQNILMTSPIHIKITDFGLARYITEEKYPPNLQINTPPPDNEDLFSTYCGSPIYMSPELLNHQQYNTKSDLWSLGVILYELITGGPPFIAKNIRQLVNKVNTENINLAGIDRVLISDECFELLSNLLSHDKSQRADWDYFFNHAWFSSIILLEEENRLIENPLCYDLISHNPPQPACKPDCKPECINKPDVELVDSSRKASIHNSQGSSHDNSGLAACSSSGLKFSDHLNINQNQNNSLNKSKPLSINSPQLDRRTRHTSIDKNFTFSLKSSRMNDSRFNDDSKLSDSTAISQFCQINLSDLKQDDIEHRNISPAIPMNRSASKPINIVGNSNGNGYANARRESRTPSSIESNASSSNQRIHSAAAIGIATGSSAPIRCITARPENNESPRAIMNALRFIKETYNYLSSDNKSF